MNFNKGRNDLNIEKLFTKFKENWEEIINYTEEKKEEYLTSLLNRVNTNNPHYIKSLPDFYFYDLVKEKVNIFLDDIGFECKRCLESCCYFTEFAYKNKKVGLQIYKEDYELLKKANGDLNGFIKHKQFNSNVKLDYTLSNLLNYPTRTESQGNLDYGFIDILKREDKYQCYYFDENRRECKIHRYRPLICSLYPFRFIKDQKELKIAIVDVCIFPNNKIDLNKKIINTYSYWEFWIAVSLFLKYIIQYGRDRK